MVIAGRSPMMHSQSSPFVESEPYHSLGEEGRFSPLLGEHDARNRAAWPWARLGAVLGGLVVLAGGIAGLMTVTASGGAQSNGEKFFLKDTVQVDIPERYMVNVTMTLPYSGLVQHTQVYTTIDSQRISYYDGRNVEIIHTNGPSFTISPNIDQLACVSDNGKDDSKPGKELQHVFPMHLDEKFRAESTTALVNGVECNVFVYEQLGEHQDDDGYIGNYTFFVSKETQRPVRFHFIGHNIFLGGSHFDEYVLDYGEIIDDEIPESLFQPPTGIQCINRKTQSEDEKESEDIQNARRWAQVHAADHDLLFPTDESVRRKESLFEEHLSAHGQKFDDIAEKRFRKAIFHSNRRHIVARNRQDLGYQLETNQFAHYSDHEMESLRGGRVSPEKETLCQVDTKMQISKEMKDLGADLPKQVDWRKAGLVLPPGDQGTCGSCWTFGSTGAMEAAVAKATGVLKPLSKQMLMDCAKGIPYGNKGCGGGSDYKAYEWVINSNFGKMATEESYPYENQDGFCKLDQLRGLKSQGVKVANATLTHCAIVTERFLNNSAVQNDESVEAFVFTLATQGPLAISINAKPKDFYFYKKGVYSSVECGGELTDLDHSVLAVAYDLNENYMVLRNSWSSSWGEQGYARVKLDSNTCGFATVPTYVKAT